MKKIIILITIGFIVLSGCGKKSITQNEFTVVWQTYLQREFEESFDEKQSMAQREKIMTKILSEYKINTEVFKEYMKKNHMEKYQKVFME
jgi:hypothetical protein